MTSFFPRVTAGSSHWSLESGETSISLRDAISDVMWSQLCDQNEELSYSLLVVTSGSASASDFVFRFFVFGQVCACLCARACR